jgi:hypothetical protein
MFGKNIMNWQIGSKFDIIPTSGSYTTTQLGDGSTLITFLSSGGFDIVGTETQNVRFLLVGGGGGGSGPSTATNGNKGGGGGKVIEFFKEVSRGSYTATVGLGGNVAANGGNTTISSGITASVATGGRSNGSSGNAGNIYLGVLYPSQPETRQLPGFFNSLGNSDRQSGGGAGANTGVITMSPFNPSINYSATFSNGSVPSANVISPTRGDGQPGAGEDSSISGSNVTYGIGGAGGPYSATQSYNAAIGYGAGFIFFNGGSPTPINAEPAYNYGWGGNGGGQAISLTAAASKGATGSVMIRFTKK